MANTMDIYKTRTMLKALEEMPPARTFLMDTFFNETKFFDTEFVEIDIKKGVRRVAPYVRPTSAGKPTSRIGYKTEAYKAPYIKPYFETKAGDFLVKSIGQNVYNQGGTPIQRARQQIGKDLAELDQMITRREEIQASDLMHTGKITVKGDGYDEEIDFGMSASHIITETGTDLWTDADSRPLEALRTWSELISDDSGLIPGKAIFGSSALNAFMDHADLKSKLDTRRIDLGIIKPTQLPKGIRYYGHINEIDLDIYSYSEKYIDPDDGSTVKTLVDPKKVLLASDAAYTTKNYGMIQDLDSLNAVRRFPSVWTEKNPSKRFIMLQSAPLLGLNQVDAFAAAQVIA